MKRSFIAILVILLMNACNSNKEEKLSLDNSDIQNIIELQDSKNVKELIKYFVDPSMQLRERACMAFASIKDTAALPSLYTMLEEEEHVAQAAAFAVGQTGSKTSIKALKKVLERSMNEATRYQLFVAIGKCGGLDENYFLASNYNVGKDARGTAWALFYLSTNKVINEAGIELALKILENESDARIRLGAAHAIGRSNLSLPWKSLLAMFKNEANDEIQMALASGLKGITKDSINSSLLDLVKSRSHNCQINFIKSVNEIDTTMLSSYCIENILSQKNINLQIASAEYLMEFPDECRMIMTTNDPDSMNWRVRTILLSPLIKLQNDEYINYARARYSLSDNLYERGELLYLLASLPDQKDALQNEILTKDSIIGTYGMRAFETIFSESSPAEKEKDYPFLIACLASNSSAIVTYSSFLLRDSIFISDDIIGLLKERLETLQLPKMAEAYDELNNTIAFMEGLDDPKSRVSNDQTINKEDISNLLNIKGFSVLTTKGEIHMKTNAYESPGTVITIARLANEGYFNGKLFHRVVPNFVIQTGCPNGDGWGGLDFTMRSEFSRLEYTTGAVGMASAGQDTESCQWFITHSPTPHLNGKYTLFAYVTEGMDVVQNMEVGDRIIEMDVIYNK